MNSLALKKVLDVLKKTSGLGGNRNLGLGAIKNVEKIYKTKSDWAFLTEQNENNVFCNLSLYHPEILENIKYPILYNLILRKGWTGSLSVGKQLKRKTVYMFSEGSIFKSRPVGHLLDLTPEDKNKQKIFPHHVYRNGFAFTVPMKINLTEVSL